MKSFGAVIARRIKVGDPGTKLEVGDLPIEPGHRLVGRVVLADGRPIPPATRVLVSREDAWDSLSAVCDAEGRFEMAGLPTERVELNVFLNGYRLSARNQSLDSNNPHQLKGVVDGDIEGLKILLEPGK